MEKPRQGEGVRKRITFSCPRVSCMMVFVFLIYSCSCATCVRIRLFSVSHQGLPVRDMEEERARDKQTLVTHHFDVRIRCLCIIGNVATVCQRTFLWPSVLPKLSCGLLQACSVVAVRSASEAPFGDANSFRQHGLDAAILLRQHVPACFISIALHVLNRHVLY